ncbi:ABC transporter substrate-binding protein [Tomitella cavernea]|uniref:ABC transporter substrate-binding protein n=1 Tax=Tomitella cavernea TaxID=1387982 RepID=A0ABP9D0K3_9ACTN|nr:ABC transporter substrate-binding protein [Tomitella cavernea]
MLAAPLAGCTRGSGNADTSAVPAAGSATTAFAQPVSVQNCGRTETFDAPPQRIITLNGHVTETLIALGAGDRIVGDAYPDSPPAPEIADTYNAIPQLSAKFPTAEQVLDQRPDLVVGGMTSAFSDKDGRGRDALEGAGIPTFLFSEYCGAGFTGLDVLRDDFTQLGEVLGTPDQAQHVIDTITAGLDGVRARIEASGAAPVPTFFYDSGTDQPTTIGTRGVGSVIAEYAGARNITPDRAKPYFSTSWETVGERAPEAVVVFDYGDETAQQKIDFLKSQPIMATTPAVQNNRFVVVPLADMFESPRMVRAADTIARGLHPSAFANEG